MALRWTAAAMQEAAEGFRRMKACKQLPLLRAAPDYTIHGTTNSREISGYGSGRWLAEQCRDQRVRVIEAENDVADYMAAKGPLATNGLESSTDGRLAAQQLPSLHADLATAHAQRAAKEAT